jgi:hypothetical protein
MTIRLIKPELRLKEKPSTYGRQSEKDVVWAHYPDRIDRLKKMQVIVWSFLGENIFKEFWCVPFPT